MKITNMTDAVKAMEKVHPGKYELRASDLLAIEEHFHGNTFGLISFVFKMGFQRGQKARAAQ